MSEPYIRIKEIRKRLNLSQEAFGNKLGVRKSTISRIESGVHGLTEQMSKLICKTFNVDPFWLESGVGEMFTAIPETIIDELVDEFKLDERDKLIIETYLSAPEEQQNAIKNFLLTLAENAQKKNGY